MTNYTGSSVNSVTTTLRASGSGSVLNLPGMTNIDIGTGHGVVIQIDAQTGGRINLPNVTQISDAAQNLARRVNVTADGAGSVIDFSSLANFLDNSVWEASSTWHSTLAAKNGGTIQAAALTTLKEVDVTLDASGTLQINNWVNWTNGVGNFSGASYVMTSLANAAGTNLIATNGSLSLPALTTLAGGALLLSGGATATAGNLTTIAGGTLSLSGGSTATVPKLSNIDAANVTVSGGVTLSLPLVQSYTGSSVNSVTTTLRASGSGSVLNLPGMTNIDIGTGHGVVIQIDAQTGGRINLPNVTQISDAAQNLARRVNVTADGAGSVIDFSSLANFLDNSVWDANWNSTLTLRNGAAINIGVETWFKNVAITFDVNSSIYGKQLVLSTGSSVDGTGDLWAGIVNQGRVVVASGSVGLRVHGDYVQSGTGTLAVGVNGTLPTDNYSKLIVDGKVSLAGTLEITRASNFAPDLFTDYAIITGESMTGTFATVTGGTIAGGDLGAKYGSSVVALSRNFDRSPLDTLNYQNTLPNQKIFFDVTQVTQSPVEFRLYDPVGKLVTLSNATPTSPNSGDVGSFLLKDVGTYELRVFAAPGDSPAYVYDLALAPIVTQPSAFRKVINGEIAAPGATDVWEFATRTGDEISLDVLAIVGAAQNLSFTLQDPDGRTIFSRTAAAESFNDADFGPIVATKNGTYSLIVDGIGDDTASYQFLLSGPEAPKITSHALKGPNAKTVNEAWFRFDQSMDTDSFSLAQDLLTFQNQDRSLSATGFRWNDPTTLVITFAAQPADAETPLFMVLSPNILNVSGAPLDQDEDRVPGEAVDDQYSATLALDTRGPSILLTEPGTTASAPIDRIIFHFSEAIDPATVTLADITSFTGPGGVNLKNQITNLLVASTSLTVFFNEQSASGQYSISIGPNISDAAGNLMDQNGDGQFGQPNDATTLAINLLSANFVVDSVANPVAATFGQTSTFNWTIRNTGNDAAVGQWWDYVYLSADDQWDINDTVIGRRLYDSNTRGALAGNGGTYSGTLTVPTPGMLPGNYRVIVRSNLLRSIPESSRNDNTLVSTAAARFDLPVLQDTVSSSRPVNYRDALYYQIDVPEAAGGGSVVVRFGTNSTSVPNELYVKKDTLPTRAVYDQRSQQGLASNQHVILSNVKPGTYYILAATAPDSARTDALGTATIHMEILVPGRFTVLDTYFGKGGTAGNRTIEINGANFDRSITAKLTDGTGNLLAAVGYYRGTAEKLYATFDLRGVTPGAYNIVLENSARQVMTFPNAMDVVSNTVADSFSPQVTAPPAFRRAFSTPFVHFPAGISWINNELNDIPTPIVIFNSNEPFTSDFNASISGTGANQKFSGTNSAAFFAYGSNGSRPPGILLPGQSGSRSYEIVPRLASVAAREAATFAIDVLYAQAGVPFNWLAEKDRLSGSYLSQEAFDDLFHLFQQQAGPSQNDYQAMLGRTAQLFQSLPEDVFEATKLLTQEAFDRFAAERTSSIIGQIEYNRFDIDISRLHVVATNRATLESYTAPVRLDGKFVFPGIVPGTYDLAVLGGAVAVNATPLVVKQRAVTATTVPVLAGGVISGSVLSATGSPVAGASLVASSESLDVSRIIELAADGSFEIADLSPGAYVLTATANGRVAATAEITIDFGGNYKTSLTLASGTVLSGTVRGPGNALVTGAQVRLFNPLTGVNVSAVTGVDGLYSFNGVPAGTWEALISHPQYQDLTRTISVSGAAKSESFTLTAGAVVTGRIVSTTGTPVEGVVVGIVTNGELRSVVTGADGLFTVAGLAPGDAQLQIDTVGYARILRAIGAISTDTPSSLGDVTLTTGFRLVGHITNSIGSPITDAVVMLESNSGLVLTSVTTGADGLATFTTLSPGVYRISVAAHGYASRTKLIEVTSDERPANLQLQVEATLSGTVAGANDGIVALYKNNQLVRRADIGDDGKYSFDKLVEGDFVVAILHQSNQYTSMAIAIEAGDQQTVNFSVAAGSLAGIVTNSTGQPVVAATVIASWIDPWTNDKLMRTVVTGSDGTYSLAGLSGGEITLTILSDEFAQRSIILTASAGQIATQNVSLQTGVRGHGSVRGPSNEAISNATIYLFDIVPNALPITATTAQDGSWEVSYAIPGSYRAFILAEGFVAYVGTLTIAPDGSSPSTTLTDIGSSLSGTVSLDGLLLGGSVVTLVVDGIEIAQTLTDSRGGYTFLDIPDGQYDVYFDHLGAISTSATVNVASVAVHDAALTTCMACTITVVDVGAAGVSARSAQARSTASAPLPDNPLQDRFDRRENLNREYNRVTSIPWKSFPANGTIKVPTEPDCFCNSVALKSRAESLNDWRLGITAEMLMIANSRVLAEFEDAALRAGADATSGVVSAKLFLAVGKYSEYSQLKKQLDAALGLLLTRVPHLLPIVGLIRASQTALEAFLGTLNSVDYALNTYSQYIQSIKANRNAFNAKIDALLKEIEIYESARQSYERDRAQEIANCPKPSGPSGSATVAKGEGKVVLLLTSADRAALAKLSANGVSWYIEEVSNPSGSGVAITPNGGAIVGDGKCGTFTIKLRLIIECDDSGFLGFNKLYEPFDGTFTLTRTPIKVPFNVNCGGDRPDDTDCYKYVVTRSGDCTAYDPNDIQGPSGAGDQNWISSEKVYSYTIGFENDAKKASVPAAIVRVTQKLDSDLDFNTFRLGTIRFGNMLFSEAVGLSSFETRLDYRETLGIYLDIRAGIDLGTGDVFWELTSIDPLTGEVPFNPLIGFLPPNVNGVEGQGYLSYTIAPRASVQTGDVIDAKATIFFDQNEPIDTPAIFNTIDVDAATSSVTALGGTSFPGAFVHWTGNDNNGSGVERFDVYVSQNNGPFELWLSQTTATEARFLDAEIGSTYRFHTVAYDGVGNIELAPETADATTTIVEPPVTTISNVQVASTDGLTITVTFADDVVIAGAIADGTIRDAITLLSYDTGTIDLSAWQFTYTASNHQLLMTTTQTLPGGTYEVQLNGERFTTASGAVLKGGHSGLEFGIPELAGASTLSAGGVAIGGHSWASPSAIDFDGDGRLDLIVGETTADGDGRVLFYRNTGTTTSPIYSSPTFLKGVSGDLVIDLPTTGGMSVRLADLSRDGDPDLIVGLPNGTVQYWLNIGNRTAPVFALPQRLQTGAAGAKSDIAVGNGATVEVIDWDNNGALDLIVGGSDGRLQFFRNLAVSGISDFAAPVTIQNGTGDLLVPTARSSVSVFDLNGDGRKDLILGNADGQVFYYRNIGSDAEPGFDGSVALSAAASPINLTGFVRSQPFVADLNGDDRPDLLLGASDGTVRFYLGQNADIPETHPEIAGGVFSHVFEQVSDMTPQVTPRLTGPVGTDISNPPLLSWTPAINADRYHLFLRNLDNGQVVQHLDLSGTSYRPSSALTDGLYRAWIRAAKTDGILTEWSSPLDFQIGLPRPITPTLNSPGSGSLGNRPQFTWNSVTDAQQYDIWINNRSSGQQQYIRNTAVDTTSFIPGVDLQQGRYRAWVRATNSTGASSWSNFVDFLVGDPEPAQTVITPPASLRTTVLPTIQWSATARAANYELWMDNLTSGEKAVVHVFNISATSYSQTANLTAGIYRVWVRAWNPTGKGAWSSPITIAVGNIAPERSSLTGPIGLTAGVRPSISWTVSAGAESYLLWVNDLTRGLAKVIHRNVTSTSFVPDADLLIGEYRAWIQSQSAFGAGVWSVPLDFAVGPIKPAKVEIVTPTGLRTNSKPTLSWKPAAYAQTYEVWIDNRTTGTVALIHQTGITGTDFSPAVNLADGIYRAWVRPGNIHGFGVWSKFIDFAVGSIAPDQVIIVRPTQAFQNPRPTLIWNIAAGADSYEVWINDLTRGVGQAVHTTVNNNAFTPTSNLANGRYRVWIRAISSHGAGLWSSAVDFEIVATDSLDGSAIDSLFEIDAVFAFLEEAGLQSDRVERNVPAPHSKQSVTNPPDESTVNDHPASVSATVTTEGMERADQHRVSMETELFDLNRKNSQREVSLAEIKALK